MYAGFEAIRLARFLRGSLSDPGFLVSSLGTRVARLGGA